MRQIVEEDESLDGHIDSDKKLMKTEKVTIDPDADSEDR